MNRTMMLGMLTVAILLTGCAHQTPAETAETKVSCVRVKGSEATVRFKMQNWANYYCPGYGYRLISLK